MGIGKYAGQYSKEDTTDIAFSNAASIYYITVTKFYRRCGELHCVPLIAAPPLLPSTNPTSTTINIVNVLYIICPALCRCATPCPACKIPPRQTFRAFYPSIAYPPPWASVPVAHDDAFLLAKKQHQKEARCTPSFLCMCFGMRHALRKTCIRMAA